MSDQELHALQSKINQIKEKPHGPDADFLISIIEKLLNDKITKTETFTENTWYDYTDFD